MRMLLALLISVGSISSSQAAVFSIDQFRIYKDESISFTDNFSNGITPTQDGNPPYFVQGSFPIDAEAAGKLTLNTDWGAYGSNAAGLPRQSLVVTRTSANNDSATGLTINNTIKVTGIFDLTSPSGPFVNGFGIRVFESGLSSIPRLLELDLQYNASFGGVVIRYLLQDFIEKSISTLGYFPLMPTQGDNQIRLSIYRPDTLSNLFFGEWAFGVDGQFNPAGLFQTGGELFTSSDYVRGQFIAATEVPVPATIALLGLGLAGIASQRSRRSIGKGAAR